MMIWILIMVYILIIILEVPGLLRKHQYRELTVFMVVFAIALYMGLAFFWQWPLRAPFEALSNYVAIH